MFWFSFFLRFGYYKSTENVPDYFLNGLIIFRCVNYQQSHQQSIINSTVILKHNLSPKNFFPKMPIALVVSNNFDNSEQCYVIYSFNHFQCYITSSSSQLVFTTTLKFSNSVFDCGKCRYKFCNTHFILLKYLLALNPFLIKYLISKIKMDQGVMRLYRVWN